MTAWPRIASVSGRLNDPHAIVVLPTYNEAEDLAALSAGILSASSRVSLLVVDDASPDGTGDLASQLAQQQPGRLACLHRPGKLGLGTAYLDGFRFALESGAELILEMDADFSHPPRYLPDLLAAADEADLVLGSRYVPGGRIVNWDLKRHALSRFGSWYARRILGVSVRDLTGGFKCYRAEVLRSIDLESIRSRGYAFQIETTYRALLAGFQVREIPITFEEREHGDSKMSKEIILEAVWRVWSFRWRRKALQRRCRELRDKLPPELVDEPATSEPSQTIEGARP